jgi:cobalt/nickel transport system permease protein
MKGKTALVAYLAAIVAATSIHSLRFLSALLLVAVILGGRQRLHIAKRAVLTILLFNSIVTLSYAVISLIQKDFSPLFVARINLRVFLMTYLTFLFNARANPFKALAFSRSLSYVLTLAYSQVLTFRRLFEDFRLALRSRTLKRPSLKDLYRHGAATGSFFMQKCLIDSEEITQAMKSRGFFDA